MYIKSLKLINIRSYIDETVSFDPGINILVGKNNSGKSTLLRSIYKLQNFHYMDSPDVRKYGNPSLGRINIELNDLDQNDRDLFIDYKIRSNEVKGNTITCLFDIPAKQGKNHHQLWFDSSYTTKPKEEDGLELFNEKGESVNFPEFGQLTNKEDENNFIYPFFSKRKTSHYNQINKDTEHVVDDNLNNLPAKIQKLISSSYDPEERYKNLCESILGFTPTVTTGDHQSLIGIYAKNKNISIHQMGEGVSNIVGLIAMLLTEDRKLYLIEELENDVHPGVLRPLLDLIIEKSAKNQFIISTHSHIVLRHLAGLEKSRLLYVDWEMNEKKEQISSVRHIQNNPSERAEIMNRLGYSISDFDLYKGYLILEESSAESIINRILIPLFVPFLSYKLKTISANGVGNLKTSAIDFGRMYVYLYTNPVYANKTWIVADGDPDGQRSIKELKKHFKKNTAHLSNWKAKNFEDYYPARFADDIKSIPDNDIEKKRTAKKNLLLKVLQWFTENPVEARNEFADSAKEVITFLNQINKKLD
jgi:AAA15 family ATPase/GTPase